MSRAPPIRSANGIQAPPTMRAPGPSAAGPAQPANPGVADDRMYYDTQTGKWQFEADDGTEMEFDTARNSWVPVLTDDLVQAQQKAYSVAGVDDSIPVDKPATRKKRKKGDNDEGAGPSKRPATDKPPQTRNSGVYVTHLPLDATAKELHDVFSRYGIIWEDDDGEPKIKLYNDDDGKPKGEALVVYLQQESVDLAIRVLDDSPLRIGDTGPGMKVQKADWSHKGGDEKEGEKQSGEKDKEKKPKMNDTEKKNAQKRAARLKQKLTDWSSDEEEEGPPAGGRVVVLMHMFTLDELEKDATLLLDLKEDIREECEKLGQVTNVVLYDQEADGVLTVKFRDPIGAQACVVKMNNRFFGGQRVRAYIYDGKRRFKKTNSGGGGDDTEADEKARLEKFAKWLEADGS